MSKRSGETEYELDRIRDKAFKLDRQLADTVIKLNNAQKLISNAAAAADGGDNHVNNHCDQNGHIILNNRFNSAANNTSSTNNNNSQNNSNAAKLNDKTVNITDKQVCLKDKIPINNFRSYQK